MESKIKDILNNSNISEDDSNFIINYITDKELELSDVKSKMSNAICYLKSSIKYCEFDSNIYEQCARHVLSEKKVLKLLTEGNNEKV